MERKRLVGFIASGVYKPSLNIQTAMGVFVTATIDTGFNGELLMDLVTATRLSVEMVGEDYPVVLAGGILGDCQMGILSIVWLGGVRDIRVLVLQAQIRTQSVARFSMPTKEVLIGTRLMYPNRLTIDFAEESVVLDRP